MLRWFTRLRKLVDRVHGVATRPLYILESRRPDLAAGLWHSPYCCTMIYFWMAVVTEQLCGERRTEADKHRILQQVFARAVKELGGAPAAARRNVLPDGHPRRLRALSNLKRVVELQRNGVDARLLIHAHYRAAVEGDGRRALPGNRWGLRTEAAHELLLAGFLADSLLAQ